MMKRRVHNLQTASHCICQQITIVPSTRRLFTITITTAFALLLVRSQPQRAFSTTSVTGTMTNNINKVKSNIMAEPNPPNWPDSVKLVRPTDSRQDILDKIVPTQDEWNATAQTFTSKYHFSNRRNVVMFAPGVYEDDINLQVGYYSQVVGLGKQPTDVQFRNCTNGVYVPALNRHIHEHGTCLDTFWRSAENFAQIGTDLHWAVSQAAPLRRVVLEDADLYLYDKSAYASGGHLANAKVGMSNSKSSTDGNSAAHLHVGGQQQFLVRHVDMQGGASGGAWSMVYVGCHGNVPDAHPGCSASASVTLVETPRVRIEKPYLAMRENDVNKFDLRIPKVIFKGEGLVGPNFDNENEYVRGLEQVYVAGAEDGVDFTANIQHALDRGMDVILSPGIYQLDKTLQIKHADQVVLGLGLATLEAPTDGSPCIHVHSGVPGVRVAGLMLEASARTLCNNNVKHSSLLEWGEDGVADNGDASNPGSMFDIFCRVGGATLGDREAIRVDSMMRLHSDHVIGDNLWLWRADHAELKENEVANYPHISPIYYQSEQNDFRVETGLIVNGNDITIHGLAVEHANGHQTVWNGERGQVAFYQCEFPYCVSHETFGHQNYTGYMIGNDVKEHEVYAPGVYTNFRNEPVQVATAMKHPDDQPGIKFVNPFVVRLDNHFGAHSVLNGKGDPAHVQGAPLRLLS